MVSEDLEEDESEEEEEEVGSRNGREVEGRKGNKYGMSAADCIDLCFSFGKGDIQDGEFQRNLKPFQNQK